MKTLEALKILGKTTIGASAYTVGGIAGIIDKSADYVNKADNDSIVGICRDTETKTIYRKGRLDGYNLIDIDSTKDIKDCPTQV